MRKHDELGFTFEDVPGLKEAQIDEKATKKGKVGKGKKGKKDADIVIDDNGAYFPKLEIDSLTAIDDKLQELNLPSTMPSFLEVKSQRKMFSVSLWGPLIIETLLHPTQIDHILEDFGIDKAYYEELCNNEIYKRIKEEIIEELPRLIKGGGFSLSAYRLAGQSMAVISDIIQYSDEDSIRLNAIKLAGQYCGLDPTLKMKQDGVTAQAQNGISVVVTLGAGVKVPEAFLGQRTTIIDGQAEEV